jgi:hypothetical protein
VRVGKCRSAGDDRGADVCTSVFPRNAPDRCFVKWNKRQRNGAQSGNLGMSTQELDQFAEAFEDEERTAARIASH